MKRLLLQPFKQRLSEIKKHYLDGYAQKSYSQEGEDRILQRLFEGRRQGFYVDVGAHHPQRFSNTYLFYTRGWHGINIDAMPGSMRLFNQFRPRDSNIECGIGETESVLQYYMFNEPALNGFSKTLSDQRHDAASNYQIIQTTPVPVRRLENVLAEQLSPNHPIDFLSVDVEGLDLQVLRSNDWDKFRPEYVLVELLDSSLANIGQDPTSEFLSSVGYEVFAKCVHTAFFRRSRRTQ